LRSAIASLAAWLTAPPGRRLLLAGLGVFVAVGVVAWIRRPGDFAGYLLVGDLALAGRHIYSDAPRVNTWPPFWSLLCVPLALLARPSPYLARGLWLALNLGLLVVILRLVTRLVHGRPLTLTASGPGLSLAAPEVLVPLLLSGRYVVANLEHLQVNILLLALTLGGLTLAAAGRPVAGGGLIGLGAAIKVMPAAFLVYLAYRRQWRAALAGAVATAALSLSPALVYGWERFRDYVAAWRAAVGAGWGAGRMNQSVLAMWDRFLGHRMAPFATRGADEVPDSGEPAVRLATALTLVVVAALALRAFGRGRPAGRARLAEWSVVFVVAALFGPVAWKAYLVVLLLPNALLYAVWRDPAVDSRTRRAAGGVLLAAFLIGGLTAHGLVGRAVAERLEMTSAVTTATLVLLGGLLWLRPRLAADGPRPGTEEGASGAPDRGGEPPRRRHPRPDPPAAVRG
jgi:alpha-1,2-mannosyltransferase